MKADDCMLSNYKWDLFMCMVFRYTPVYVISIVIYFHYSRVIIFMYYLTHLNYWLLQKWLKLYSPATLMLRGS
jgi:hypothetical protein